MNAFFKELFEYNHHFNQKLISVFEENPNKISEKPVKLINHILNAHQIWNNRVEFKQTLFGVWDFHNTSDLKNIDKSNYEQTLQILNKFDLNESVNYTNSKEQAFGNSIRDILFHIINHSTYHKAQIVTELKNQDLIPLNTDYIFFKRQNLK